VATTDIVGFKFEKKFLCDRKMKRTASKAKKSTAKKGHAKKGHAKKKK
jgi:hypothetical protein